MESESIHNNKVVNVLIRIYWKGATQHELSDRKNHKGNDRRDYLGRFASSAGPARWEASSSPIYVSIKCTVFE